MADFFPYLKQLYIILKYKFTFSLKDNEQQALHISDTFSYIKV